MKKSLYSILSKTILIIGLIVSNQMLYADFDSCCTSSGRCGISINQSWKEVSGGITYDCVCNRAGGTCTPRSSSSGSSTGGSSTGGYGGQDVWKYQMMQGLMKSFMDGMVQGMEKKEQRLKEQRAKEEEERKKQAELKELKRIQDEQKKKIAGEEWKRLKLREAQNAIEEAQKKRAEADLLSKQIESSAGGLQVVPIGGGTSFFGSRNAATQGFEFKPIGTAKYDASGLKSLSRAMCSTYFSNQALLAGNDLDKARYYNSQADKVTAGEMYEEECKIPVMPEPPDPKQVLSSEDAAYLKKMETMTLEIQQGIKQLQLIDTKLQDNKLKIQEAQKKKEKAEQTINDIQAKATTMTPEEQQKLNALVAEAEALLSEAKTDLQTANQTNDKLIDEQNQIQKSIQEKYR